MDWAINSLLRWFQMIWCVKNSSVSPCHWVQLDVSLRKFNYLPFKWIWSNSMRLLSLHFFFMLSFDSVPTSVQTHYFHNMEHFFDLKSIHFRFAATFINDGANWVISFSHEHLLFITCDALCVNNSTFSDDSVGYNEDILFQQHTRPCFEGTRADISQPTKTR